MILAQSNAKIKPMTFYPAQPTITHTIGGITYYLYTTPEVYITSSDGTAVRTETFQSRNEAEHRLACIIAGDKGYQAFFAGRDRVAPVLTPTLEAAWLDGWDQACDVGYAMICQDRFYADVHDECWPDSSIEDDNLWHSRGQW